LRQVGTVRPLDRPDWGGTERRIGRTAVELRLRVAVNPEWPLKSVSILYVEDNDDLRETIGMLLEGEGREVVTRANGEHALATLAERGFDVIITDVSLPGMSGTELARRALATDPQRWVVLCSGYEFRRGLEQLGPNVRSLPKPFEIEDLEALMAEVIAAVRANAAA